MEPNSDWYKQVTCKADETLQTPIIGTQEFDPLWDQGLYPNAEEVSARCL